MDNGIISKIYQQHLELNIKQQHLPGLSSAQSLSRVPLFATPWTAARWTSLSLTHSQNLLKLIKLVVPSNHLILFCPLFLLPSILPSIRVFSNESVLYIRWPKYWSLTIGAPGGLLVKNSPTKSGGIGLTPSWGRFHMPQGN